MPASGAAYSRKAMGFDKYYNYASAPGMSNDVANLYDSPGNDSLIAGGGVDLGNSTTRTQSPYETNLYYNSGPLAGMRFYLFTFETVNVASSAGGTDTAYFWDDPNSAETFTGNDTLSRFKRNNPGWDISAQNFEMAYVYGSNVTDPTKDDRAQVFDSLANDVVQLWGRYDPYSAVNEGYLRYSGSSSRQTYVKGFETTTFKMTTGGTDAVTLNDSYNNDTFTGETSWAQMTDDLATYLFRIEGLTGGPVSGDRVTINRLTGTGSDRDTHLSTIDYVFNKIGTWLP
jgi:hypothetical protein